jgi:hypothetical protein
MKQVLPFSLLLFFLSSCKIPSHSIVFFNDTTQYNKNTYLKIPGDWDNRLLTAGKTFGLGGETFHQHGILHSHSDISSPSSVSFEPLGLFKPAPSAGHTHVVSSYAQFPRTSGAASYNVRSRELTCYITKHTLNKIPVGLIMIYTGESIPAGWQVCDGTRGSPNLSSVYIRLKQQDCRQSPTGSNVHVHSINHSHKWSVYSPDPKNNLNKALALDEVVYPGDTILLTPFSHIHGVIEKPMTDTLTEPAETFPPSICAIFIMATVAAKRIPENTLIPTLKTSDPWGWKRWAALSSWDETFFFATTDSSSVLKTFGSPTHLHGFTHMHELELTAVPRNVLKSSSDKGPEVALSTHTHTVSAKKRMDTDLSSSLPPFIRFSFIRKK